MQRNRTTPTSWSRSGRSSSRGAARRVVSVRVRAAQMRRACVWGRLGLAADKCRHAMIAAWPHRPGAGRRLLRFLHPTPNGRDPGGWMEEEARERAGGSPEQNEEERAAAAAGKGWDALHEYDWDEVHCAALWHAAGARTGAPTRTRSRCLSMLANPPLRACPAACRATDQAARERGIVLVCARRAGV